MAFNQKKALESDRDLSAQQHKLRQNETPEEEGFSVSQNNQEAHSEKSNPERIVQAQTSVKDAFAPRSSANGGNSSSNHSSSNGTSQESKLSLKDEALIGAIAQHKKWTDKQIQEVKRRMIADPAPYLARLKNIYESEIRPFLKKVPSINDWVNQNPNTVAFQFENAKGEITSKALPLSNPRADEYKIYHGILMRSVNADETPFAPPSELFKIDVVETVQNSEEAFEESSPLTEAASNQEVAQFSTLIRSGPKM